MWFWNDRVKRSLCEIVSLMFPSLIFNEWGKTYGKTNQNQILQAATKQRKGYNSIPSPSKMLAKWLGGARVERCNSSHCTSEITQRKEGEWAGCRESLMIMLDLESRLGSEEAVLEKVRKTTLDHTQLSSVWSWDVGKGKALIQTGKELKPTVTGPIAVGRGDPGLAFSWDSGNEAKPSSPAKATCSTGASPFAFFCFSKEVGSQYSAHKLYSERKTKDFEMTWGKCQEKFTYMLLE